MDDVEKLITEIKNIHDNNYMNLTGGFALEVFLQGKCYYFAKLLQKFYPEGRLYLYKHGDHVAIKIGSKLYDVGSDLSEEEMYRISYKKPTFSDYGLVWEEEFGTDGLTKDEILEAKENYYVMNLYIIPGNEDDRKFMEKIIENIYNDVLEQYYAKEPETGKVPKA